MKNYSWLSLRRLKRIFFKEFLGFSVGLWGAGAFAQQLNQGTGGIGFELDGGSWKPAHGQMPVITGNRDQFAIRFAGGKIINVPTGNVDLDRFYSIWYDLHAPTNGYFSSHDIPYHAKETFIVEAPDYGHLTTSEAISYWIWLEAKFAEKTGDLATLDYAFDVMERYIIPKYQPHVSAYQPYSPATYAPEKNQPSLYPVAFDQGVRPGSDPISDELRSVYGSEIYGMHWLIDVDNWYGFGRGKEPVFINTFQRGVQESVWETVPHPSIDEFQYGSQQGGYISLYTADPNGYSKQWRYTNAPDADARVVQAVYGLIRNAQVQNRLDSQKIARIAAKTRKMGDFLRYATFDKYFKSIGCQSPQCPPGVGSSSRHDLIGWYYAWGGSTPSGSGQWSWRIGSSHIHFGYQNPVAAWALSQEESLMSPIPSARNAWDQSLKKQKEFYQWLQSSQGAIAGGATNSVEGSYQAASDRTSSFYGLIYEENPVYADPGSNTWFGWQAWSMQRLAEYYLVTKDVQVKPVLDQWVKWVLEEVKFSETTWQIPSTIRWMGQPETWSQTAPRPNTRLSVEILDSTRDVGITSALAKTLLQYARASLQQEGRSSQVTRAQQVGQKLLENLWTQRDTHGLSVAEERGDYARYRDQVFVPRNYVGITPQGNTIDSNSTFLSLRPQYLQDPGFHYVQEAIMKGEKPVFYYHRFWAQVEAALAYADASESIATPSDIP
jgi:hypothetical protein